MKYLIVLFAALVGALIPFQGAVNSQLGKTLGQPFVATLVSFLGGTLTVLAIVLVINGGTPKWTPDGPTPWYLFVGGLPGVVFVTTTLILIPRLGYAATVGPMLVGQVLATLVFDHFGWLGSDQRPMNATRLIGAALLISGLLLIVRDRGKQTPSVEPDAELSEVISAKPVVTGTRG